MTIRMGIVDGHTLVREGFRAVIMSEGDMEVVFEGRTFEEAEAYLNGSPDIHILIVDLSSHQHDAVQLIKLAIDNNLKVIAVNLPTSGPSISDTKRAGVNGYISQGANAAELLKSIKAVSNGETFCSKDIRERLKSTELENPFVSLTLREMQICRHIIDVVKIKKIASLLDISPKTVYVHKANAYKKLKINSTQSLFKLAKENGIQGL